LNEWGIGLVCNRLRVKDISCLKVGWATGRKAVAQHFKATKVKVFSEGDILLMKTGLMMLGALLRGCPTYLARCGLAPRCHPACRVVHVIGAGARTGNIDWRPSVHAEVGHELNRTVCTNRHTAVDSIPRSTLWIIFVTVPGNRICGCVDRAACSNRQTCTYRLFHMT
jgi:hypothetical protein